MKNQKFYSFLHKQIPVVQGLSLVPGLAYVFLGIYYDVLKPALIWYGLVALVSLWGVRLYRKFDFERMTRKQLDSWYTELSLFFYSVFMLWTLIFIIYIIADMPQMKHVAIFTQMGTAVLASTLLMSDRRLYIPIILIFIVPLLAYYVSLNEFYAYALAFLSCVFSWLLFYAAHTSNSLLTKTRYQASHDMLTGLGNRYYFIEQLQQVINQLRGEGGYSYLLLIDLDHFKSVNDSLGHDVGDLLLQEVAERLRRVASANNILARLGGDEFIIVGQFYSDKETAQQEAVQLSDRLVEMLKLIYVINEHHIYISCSVGVSLVDARSENANRFIKEADIAMYEVKATGRDGVFLFNDELSRRVERHLEIERKLFFAVNRGEILLHFQPQLDANKNVVGAEALARWNNPDLGNIPPDVFIPIAEQTGLIVDLGNYILEHAFRTLKAWDAKGVELQHLSINISMRQLLHDTFADSVRYLAGQYLDAALCSKVIFEITESIQSEDMRTVIAHMQKISELGIRFSMDDFGTGYSSLSNIRQLAVSEIKIDRTFVAEIERRESDQTMIRTILGLARLMKYDVVAEGVETQGQMDFLLANDCRIFQGFMFSRPLSDEEFEQFFLNKTQRQDAS